MTIRCLGLTAVGVLGFSMPALATTITFDGTGAPCCFASTTPLTTFYLSDGVTFDGVDGNGGSILNQSGNFGFSARSGTDFYAFNTSVSTGSVVDLLFVSPVTSVSIWGASRFAHTFLLEGYNASNVLVASDSLSASVAWGELSIGAASISYARLSASSGAGQFWAYDDLAFDGTGSEVPEPGSLALLGLGLAGLRLRNRRRPN